MMLPPPSFPFAQQPQIIRANQRDLYHVSLLKEQADAVLRSWLGTRWLTKWEKEVELLARLIYYGLTTGRALQTLGEEYTDIWQYSSPLDRVPPSRIARVLLVLLPTIPGYLLPRISNLSRIPPRLATFLKRLPTILEVIAEVNLALFYITGTYYDIVKRLLRIRQISSTPGNPHVRPPSYALLGVLLSIRLLYRLRNSLKGSESVKGKEKTTEPEEGKESFLDDRPVSSLLMPVDDEDSFSIKDAEEDERTILDVASIPGDVRDARKCTLCLEERTDSCSTECGHLFCWGCIVGWGREKAECPLCRQSLNLTRLLPIYNL
ncbi:hypothetical protein BDN72DRAFT_783075, partial [Pluteus cervinus]